MSTQPITLTITDTWHDSAAVHSLWLRALADRWPIRESVLALTFQTPIVAQGGFYVAAHQAGTLIGFACVQVNLLGSSYQRGNLQYILVDPSHQRQGVGRRLIDALIDRLRSTGSTRALAGGRYPRVWPGIPENLPNARSFFQALGWTAAYTDYDLGRQLADYRTPDAITARIAAENVIIEAANLADADAIQALQDREFSGWADTYRYVIGLGDVRDVLVARDPHKGIIGSLLMYGPGSHPDRLDADWRDLHGEAVGGLGEVGVADSERKRGLGLALVARGSELLQARGVDFCHIGYTSLVDFYGKLGYQVWQKYEIFVKVLTDAPDEA